MSLSIKDNSGFREAKLKVKINEGWGDVKEGFVKTLNGWELFYRKGSGDDTIVPIEIITHVDGGKTYRALAEAEEDTFYYVDEIENWVYVPSLEIVDFVIPTILGGDGVMTMQAPLLHTIFYSSIKGHNGESYEFEPYLTHTDSKGVTQNFTFKELIVSRIETFGSAQGFLNPSSDISTWDTSNFTNMDELFLNIPDFNSDISNWDVSNVVSMDYMFEEASSFNQDLSQWCVANIATKPEGFDNNTTSWTLPKPVWGTCPHGEDQL